MRVLILHLFLTLVVLPNVSLAAPNATTTWGSDSLSGESDPYLSDKASPLRTPAPIWQVSVYAGYAGGNYLENNQWPQGLIGGFRIANLDRDFPVWDLHLEFATNNIVGVFVGRRWYIQDDRFTPYARLAAGTFLDPADELGNLVQIKRFRVRAGAGIGEMFTFEMGVGVAVVGPDLYALLGYNYNF